MLDLSPKTDLSLFVLFSVLSFKLIFLCFLARNLSDICIILVEEETMEFSEAAEHCSNMSGVQGHLLTIMSEDEQEKLDELM